MALTGFTGGRLALAGEPQLHARRSRSSTAAASPRRRDRAHPSRSATRRASALHDALMDRCGWPPIPYDGQLLVSHQDALLMGGKVQAPAGLRRPRAASSTRTSASAAATRKLCIEICSGAGHHARRTRRARRSTARSASTAAPACGTAQRRSTTTRRARNIAFRAGAGGLHSAEN